jgi:predicted CXXCH cytochrome family protein
MRKPIEETCLGCHRKIARHIAGSTVQHAAMVTGNSCANCHEPHASQQPELLRQRTQTLCLSCHDKPITATDGRLIANMKPVLTESKFLHGPIRNGACSACHDPHGSKFPSLLDQAFPKAFYTSFETGKYELCFKCHQSDMVQTAKTTTLTGFRDGDRNLHFVHVNREEKGRSCRTCHSLHGSNLPRHMASEVPFEGSTWTMPIEFEQMADGGRCAPGCHAPKAYSRTKPVPATQPAIVTRGEE